MNITSAILSVLAYCMISLLFCQSAGAQIYAYFDPGHGGSSAPGVPTPIDGYNESDINLEVGLELEAMLAVNADIYTPVFSRTTDVFVANTTRAYQANQLNSATLLSIHHNSGPPDQNYTTVLYSTLFACDGADNPWLNTPRATTPLFARKIGYRVRDGFHYTLHADSPWDMALRLSLIYALISLLIQLIIINHFQTMHALCLHIGHVHVAWMMYRRVLSMMAIIIFAENA